MAEASDIDYVPSYIGQASIEFECLKGLNREYEPKTICGNSDSQWLKEATKLEAKWKAKGRHPPSIDLNKFLSDWK